MELPSINGKHGQNTISEWSIKAQKHIEQSNLVKSILNLTKIIPDKSQVYSVLCYVLTEKVSHDGSHGVLFIEGTYPREDMAKKEPKN